MTDHTGIRQPVRIYDELTRPGATWVRSGHRELVPADLLSNINYAVRVTADDVWDWGWSDVVDKFRLDTGQFGPVRLPFSMMWVEGRFPMSVRSDGEYHPRPALASAALLADAETFAPLLLGSEYAPDESAYAVVAHQFVQCLGGPIVEIGSPLAVYARADGSMLGAVHLSTVANSATHARHLLGYLKPALLTLSMVNCKNIKIVEHEGPSRASKKSRRKKPAGLSYHTIQLPAKRGASTKEMSSALGGGVALHKVRGHFKTYTAEAPLMGQHTGTYWWGWHTRGDLDHGEVRSDYNVRRTP